jgi:hypothetical protein
MHTKKIGYIFKLTLTIKIKLKKLAFADEIFLFYRKKHRFDCAVSNVDSLGNSVNAFKHKFYFITFYIFPIYIEYIYWVDNSPK